MQESANAASARMQARRAEAQRRRRRNKKIWRNCVSVMACVVVFCVTYALILPAITMEKDTFCGVEAHVHEAQCYAGNAIVCDPAGDSELPILHTHDELCYDGETLICTLQELAGHVHTDSCYETVTTEAHTHDETCNGLIRGELLCTVAEEAGHKHEAACYIPGETLICTETVREGHAHTDSCYTVGSELTCTAAEGEGHTHGDSCYTTESTLTCTVAEGEGHTHGEACVDTDGNLVCAVPEAPAHTHDDSCHTQSQVLVCTTQEAPAHTHGDGCYSETKTLTCEIPEDPGHAHTDTCYEQVLGCGQEEKDGHAHADACYEMVSTLTCGKEESAETVTVRNLICTQPQIAPHTHDGNCSDESGNLICTIQDAIVHQHTEECVQPAQTEENLICDKQVHEHTLICYSDPTADLETAEDWEKTFADLELTGDWRQDVVALAKTQLGYEESTKNYIVEGENAKGYTRYGDWYGIPYGDWCAMFASFCLDYAGVEGMPLDCNCPNWIDTLNNNNLYQVSGGYAPQSGDLIFFDWNADGSSDHVGIVVEFTPAEGDTAATVRTIEGNSGNCVKYNSYNMDDATIMGYGTLPAQLTEEEQAQVDYVISLIDAMPSADEIDAKIEEFEEAEDYEGEEAWLTETYQQVAMAYYYYDQLGETLQPYVTNADKLLELEYIWSVTEYAVISADDIVSDAPTVADSVSTRDFIDLNIYDYGSNINQLYSNNPVSYSYTSGGETYTKNTSKYPGFQWNGGAYLKSDYKLSFVLDGTTVTSANRHKIDSIDFGNSMITDLKYSGSGTGKSTTATDITINKTRYYNINSMDVDNTYGVTNRPIGMSLASSVTDTSKDVLLRTLGSDGYPALKDGTSLSYLFTDGTYADQKNSKSIDGLFQQRTQSGEYYYNSRWNHAQYSNDTFTLYNQIITPNFITYPFGNFLPFNSITEDSVTTQVSKITSMSNYVQGTINDLVYAGDYDSNATKQQLVNMLAMYRNNVKYYGINGKTWTTFTAKDAIVDYFCGDTEDGDNPSNDTGLITNALLSKMYNIDWDVETNFFFGMNMNMTFMMPKDGLTGKDNGNNSTGTWQTDSNGESYLTGNPDGIADYPMEFYFTGDDDVWVYIDDVLFLDLSGIHRHVGGEIDFVNGVVNYYYLDTANTGDVSATPYKSYTFAQILSAAGKSTDGLNSNGTFKDYTTHTFKFYYMERGSGSSVCRLNFNFPLLRQNSISVAKDVTADTQIKGDPDYKFQVLKANTDGTKTTSLFIGANTAYTIYDADSNTQIGTGTTDANGVFTLKAGQRAEFIGIKENAGKYYVRELLEGTVLAQYGNVTVSGESTTVSQNVTVGTDSFTGMDSPVKDISDGATLFRFTNDVDETKLGTLSVSKKLSEYSLARAVKTYDIQVSLDGELLPVGTEYTVGNQTRTVTKEKEGIITIAADETAVISNILAGTEFQVAETSGSAEGYMVTYSTENGYTVEQVSSGGVKGVIKSSADVQLIVTNAEKGTSVTIPGTKSMSAYDGTERTFTFRLNEVTDATGTTLKEGGLSNLTTTATVSSAKTAFSFTLNYAQVDMQTLPVTFYYKITEDAADGVLTNTQSFVAEVTVTKAVGSTEITAAVTGMWKDGVKIETSEQFSADFVNTITGDLKLEKIVDGGTEAQSQDFTFQIELQPGTSGLTELPASYSATFYQQDGTEENKTVTTTNNVITLSGFKHGETAVIHGVPHGATWKITESGAAGYNVKTEVTVNSGTAAEGTGTVTNGTIVAGDTSVVYTNVQLYALPETGGTGTQMYTMAGLMLLLMGTAFLLYRCRKRRREVS